MGYVMTSMMGRIITTDIPAIMDFLDKKLPKNLFRASEQEIILKGYTEEFYFWGEEDNDERLDIIIDELIRSFPNIKLELQLTEEYSCGGGENEITVSYGDRTLKTRIREFMYTDDKYDTYEEYLDGNECTEEQVSKEEFERCKENNLIIYTCYDGNFFPEDKIPEKYYTEKIVLY